MWDGVRGNKQDNLIISSSGRGASLKLRCARSNFRQKIGN